jgi:hypothetical protein
MIVGPKVGKFLTCFIYISAVDITGLIWEHPGKKEGPNGWGMDEMNQWDQNERGWEKRVRVRLEIEHSFRKV